jgi:uncharacterized membrane protein HdeD (DUF308 family)
MDIRIPIGLLFFVLGAVLGIYGLVTSGSPMYQRSLDTNLNLWSGVFLLLFGAAMLALAFRAEKRKKTEAPRA